MHYFYEHRDQLNGRIERGGNVYHRDARFVSRPKIETLAIEEKLLRPENGVYRRGVHENAYTVLEIFHREHGIDLRHTV